MSRRRTTGPGALLLAVLLVPPVVMALVLGPSRAVRIAGAGAANSLLDRTPAADPVHRIPVIDVEVDQGTWDRVAADLPWSAAERMPAAMHVDGLSYPGSLKFRGAYATTHFKGAKKSFRLNLKRDNPFAPYRRLNVVNPKSQNMLNAHLSLWVATGMGVLAPFDRMVHLRVNGDDVGVMELYEQIGGDVLRNRHLASADVPVYRGDYPPMVDRRLPAGRSLWASAAHWEYMGDADSTAAYAQLQAIVRLLGQPHAAVRDSLDQYINVDAFLRYAAAIVVVGTTHIDNYHNQWLVAAPDDGRFHPVFWDALMLYQADDAPFYAIHDALAHHLLRDAGWRLQRDRYIHEALGRLFVSGAFHRKLAVESERMRPSMMADRRKNAVITDRAEDVYRISSLHVAASADRLGRRVSEHVERTIATQRITGWKYTRAPADVFVEWNGPSAVRLEWRGDSAAVPELEGAVEVIGIGWADGLWSALLGVPVVHSDGPDAHHLTDGGAWLPQPARCAIRFKGPAPTGMRAFNAVTDDEIHAGH